MHICTLDTIVVKCNIFIYFYWDTVIKINKNIQKAKKGRQDLSSEDKVGKLKIGAVWTQPFYDHLLVTIFLTWNVPIF